MICTKRFSTKLNCSSFLTCEFLINYSDAFGGKSADNMFSVMEERLAAAREVYPNISLDYQIFTETCPLLVSIVTPLMKRIHREVSNYFSTITLGNIIIFYIFTVEQKKVQELNFYNFFI